MNKLSYIIIGLNLMYVFSLDVLAAEKIAVVNVSSIFQHDSNRTGIAKKLENEFKPRANELQSMERELQNKVQHLQRDGSIMKVSERSLLEKTIAKQREDFSNKAQKFEQDNHRRQTEERNKILNRIQSAVRNVAVKEGYDIVIDANVVAYFDSTKDITEDVLKQIK